MSGSTATRTFALRLTPGADLRGSIEAFARDNALQAAYVATCVGSVKSATIRFANQPAPERLEGPFEILSLVGMLSPDGGHLHIALADAAGKTLGGHLALGTPVHTTAEIVIVALDGVAFSRRRDETTGYPELVVGIMGKCSPQG